MSNLSDILASTNTNHDESLSQREQSSVSTRMSRGMRDSIRSMIVGGKKAECSFACHTTTRPVILFIGPRTNRATTFIIKSVFFSG